MDLFNGRIQRYYGETDADFMNRITYEFMNREPENTTYPGEMIIMHNREIPNYVFKKQIGDEMYYFTKRFVQIDVKNPIASFLAAERLVPNRNDPYHINDIYEITWCGYYHGVGWRNMKAFRWGEGENEITIKEVAR